MTGHAGNVAHSRRWRLVAPRAVIFLGGLQKLPLTATRKSKTVVTTHSDERQMPVDQLITGRSECDRAGLRGDLPDLRIAFFIRYLRELALEDLLRQLFLLPENFFPGRKCV
jgi:hypothetical protein